MPARCPARRKIAAPSSSESAPRSSETNSARSPRGAARNAACAAAKKSSSPAAICSCTRSAVGSSPKSMLRDLRDRELRAMGLEVRLDVPFGDALAQPIDRQVIEHELLESLVREAARAHPARGVGCAMELVGPPQIIQAALQVDGGERDRTLCQLLANQAQVDEALRIGVSLPRKSRNPTASCIFKIWPLICARSASLQRRTPRSGQGSPSSRLRLIESVAPSLRRNSAS